MHATYRTISLLSMLSLGAAAAQAQAKPLEVGGVYPAFTHYNGDGECGPGALVPWAGKLWLVTYPAHQLGHSSDKLYSFDPARMEMVPFAGSVGGTHANRLIHRESQQLIIGCYVIDKEGNVRVIPRSDSKNGVYGRITGTARHLTDPANKVYMVTMEGVVYETNVYTLESKMLFKKPVPGHHGKGAYTAQGRLVVSNNGEIDATGGTKEFYQVTDAPKTPETMGILAEYDGSEWRIVERKQFTEVTGPGGIYGNAKDSDPLWALGWDKRSVMLKLLEGGAWYTYRLPKNNVTYDHMGGWYTEWPRIREVGGGKMLMDMHGMFYRFSPDFSLNNPQPPVPIASHLMYTADFCDWNGKLVIGKHSTTRFENPRAGRAQSAPWFGTWDELYTFGPRQGQGSLWRWDPVKAGEASDPFLVKGFDHVTLFLSAKGEQSFTLRTGKATPGKGIVWKDAGSFASGNKTWLTYPINTAGADWVSLVPAKTAEEVCASFVLTSKNFNTAKPELFKGLAKIGEKGVPALLRPAPAPSKALQAVFYAKDGTPRYKEMDPVTLTFKDPGTNDIETVERLCLEKEQVWFDDASAIIKDKSGKNWRVPVANPAYARPFGKETPTSFREIVSERRAANIAGTFFIHGYEKGVSTLQPVATHNLDIRDFCTWAGMLVLSGVKADAPLGGRIFGEGDAKLWLGKEDDIWLMGKPVGDGGPWKNTQIKKGKASDPYLFFGYDRKTLTLSHNSAAPVTFTVELDADRSGFFPWKTFTVKPGETFTYTFAEGFSAFWIRCTADADCTATAQLSYR